MSRTSDRLRRLLALVPYVLERGGEAAVSEVASRFGYSEAQLAADLDLLFVCGLPGYRPDELIVAYIDADNVVIDVADYFARPLRLTGAEALGLVAAGHALEASGHAPEALRSAVAKVDRALGLEEGVSVRVQAEPEVAMLTAAAAGREPVAIRYHAVSTGEISDRVVEPWAVFETFGNWYLEAWCRLAHGPRNFRIDRIESALPALAPFEGPEPRPRREIGVPGEGIDTVFELAPSARWVADYFTLVDVEELDDGRLRATLRARHAAFAAELALRLGDTARVLGPPEVPAEMRRQAASILAAYAAQSPAS